LIVTLGLLSLLQIFVFPGLIVVKFAKIPNPWINFLITISISPIINSLLVFLLVLCKIYTQPVMLSIFVIEIIVLLILYFSTLTTNFEKAKLSVHIKEFFAAYLKPTDEHSGWGFYFVRGMLVAAILAAVASILYYFFVYGTQTTAIFNSWDAIFSWDRWAVEWAKGLLPTNVYHYPQLLPANFSITYKFIDEVRVKFFARMFTNYIEIFVLLAIFIAGVITKKSGYFWGVVFTAWLEIHLGSKGTGYADTPSAYWGLISLLFLLFSKSDTQNRQKYLIFGAIFAAGSMAVKQAGGWIVFIYVLLLFMMYWKEEKVFVKSLLWKIGLIYFVVIVPWYAYAEWSIINGQSVSEIQRVMKIASTDVTWLGTMTNAFKLLFSHLSTEAYSAVLIFLIFPFLLFFSRTNKFWRRINILISTPYFILWIFYFSYDIRNMNLIVPLVGIAAGIGFVNLGKLIATDSVFQWITAAVHQIGAGIKNLVSWIFGLFSQLKLIYIMPLFLLVFLLPQRYTDTYMISKSVDLQKQIGNLYLNERIYEYLALNEDAGKIMTDYMWLGYLPEIDRYFSAGDPRFDSYIDRMENDDQIEYILISINTISAKVDEYVTNKVDENEIELVFSFEEYRFYKLCRGVCNPE
jgi:hypothetical protein